MELLRHNKEAYESVMAHFNNSDRAAVIHATGTGKSYIGGAVAENFKRVIIVAPNEHVLGQASKSAPHAECVTYSWLTFQETLPTDIELIWFDEFHRMGAETWAVGCQRLIDANPQAKILGTTATSERSLEKRDMADEWFKNNVVSTLSISDAWVKRILRVPVYVIGVISMDDTKSDYMAKIANAKRIDDNMKKQANVMLDNVILNWKNSCGVPRILKKYIDDEVERIVVFAQTIERMNEMEKMIPSWFKEAGIKIANVYSVCSNMGAEARRNLKAFEDDNNEGVKMLLSVDMLNEGIHVDRVDAVIMFRATISKNIYMQQIGRCFAVGQKHQPIILDLADNLSKACGYDGIYEAKERFDKEKRDFENPLNKEDYDDEFQIIDTLKDVKEVLSRIDKITADHRSWDEIQEYIQKFYDENGRLPNRNDDESVYSYIKMHRNEYYKEKYPERIEFLKSLGWVEEKSKLMDFKTAIAIIEDYKEKNGKLPPVTVNAMKYVKTHLRHSLFNDEQRKIVEGLGITYVPFIESWMKRYEEMKAIYDATGSLESLNKEQRGWIYSQQRTKLLKENQIALLNAIGAFDLKKRSEYKSTDSVIAEVVDWVKEHGYLPTVSENSRLYSNWHGAYARNPKIWKKYNECGINESHIKPKEETTMQVVEAYYKEHGELPKYSSKLGKQLRSALLVEENRKYARVNWGWKNQNEIIFDEKFEYFKTWVREHGYLPKPNSKLKDEVSVACFMQNHYRQGHSHYEEIHEFCKDYEVRDRIINNTYSDEDLAMFEKLKEYVKTTGRVPKRGSDLEKVMNKFSTSKQYKNEYRELFAPFGLDETKGWYANALKVQGIMDFFEKNQRLPKSDEVRGLYDTLQLSKKWKKQGLYKMWTDKFEAMGFDYSISKPSSSFLEFRQRIVDFLIENHRLPSGAKEKKAVQDFGNFRRLHREDFDAILKEYGIC